MHRVPKMVKALFVSVVILSGEVLAVSGRYEAGSEGLAGPVVQAVSRVEVPMKLVKSKLSPAEACKKKYGHTRCLSMKYWKGNDQDMLRVFECESHFNPRAQNSCCRGIAQLHQRYHKGRAAKLGYTWEGMYDPGKNVRVAWDLWKEQGWQPWSCRARR